MNIEAIPANLTNRSIGSTAADSVQERRKKTSADTPLGENTDKQNAIQPEELLQNIKALTEGGLYSVRFEMNHETKELIINLVDYESGEVIRQIPPEEIVDLHEYITDLRGNIVNTES